MLDAIELRLARRRLRTLGRETLAPPSARPTGLDKIEHVVVLMMENHSYDNNGGDTWTRVGGTPGNTALIFFNPQDGVVLSDTFGRTLSRTDDGGATWSKVTLRGAS